MRLDNIDFLLLDYLRDFAHHVSRIGANNADEIFSRPNHFLTQSQLVDKLEFLQGLGLVRCEEDGYVYLTRKGGVVWEEKFSPNWENFLECTVFFKFNLEIALFRSTSHEKLESLLEHGASYGRFHIIKSLASWAPFYWACKTSAYEVIVVLNDFNADFRSFSNLIDEVRGLWVKKWVSHSYQDGIAWPTEV